MMLATTVASVVVTDGSVGPPIVVQGTGTSMHNGVMISGSETVVVMGLIAECV